MASDPLTVQSRKRTLLRLAAIAFLAIAVTAAVSVLGLYGPHPAQPLSAPGRSGAIGTGGTEPEQARSREPAALPPTGASALLGQRVSVRTPGTATGNQVAFWVEHNGHRLLAVADRDRRSGGDRQQGVPAPHGIANVTPGQRAVVSGVVEELPRAEERYSWNLTNTDAATVAEEGVYLRVETIVPEDLGAVHAAPSHRPPVP